LKKSPRSDRFSGRDEIMIYESTSFNRILVAIRVAGLHDD
jgi:hypothetical protein